MKFEELNLSPQMLSTLDKMGFKELTPIQEQTYPHIIEGRDLCALAETGSGKTSACAIPLIQKVDPEMKAIQAIVMVPTRELCIQYMSEIEKLSQNTGVVSFPVYGGTDKSSQAAKIKQGVHILVATPGRLIDLIMDGTVSLSKVQCFILDEADELLAVGFLDDVQFILSCCLQEHQTLLFSATMSDEIKLLAEKSLRDPVNITLIQTQKSPQSIEHRFIRVSHADKHHQIEKILNNQSDDQCLIFCNGRHRVDSLFKELQKKHKKIDYLHGGLPQDKRSRIFEKFKQRKLQILIATDVAGRGLDFSSINSVINLDFPESEEQYMHRSGRVGRMGRAGLAISLVTSRDVAMCKKLIDTHNLNATWHKVSKS